MIRYKRLGEIGLVILIQLSIFFSFAKVEPISFQAHRRIRGASFRPILFHNLVVTMAKNLGLYELGVWGRIIEEAISLLNTPASQRNPQFDVTKHILAHYEDPTTSTAPNYDVRAVIELFWMANIMVNGVGTIEEKLARIKDPEITGQRVGLEGTIFTRVLGELEKLINSNDSVITSIPEIHPPAWWLEAWNNGQLKKLLRLYGGTDSSLIKAVEDVAQTMGCTTKLQKEDLLKGLLRKERSPDDLAQIMQNWIKNRPKPKVMFAGGGGGVVNATLPALMDMYDYVAGLVGTTNDGDSIGDLKRFLYNIWGYIWGYDSAVDIMEKALLNKLDLDMNEAPQTRILSFRPMGSDTWVTGVTGQFSKVLVNKIKKEMRIQKLIDISGHPEYKDAMKIPGFLPFVVDLLNTAEIVDEVLESREVKKRAGAMTYAHQSVKNLMGLAVYHKMDAFKGNHIDPEMGKWAMYVLEYMHRIHDLGVPQPVHPLAATYDEVKSYVTIKGEISPMEIKRLEIGLGLSPTEENALIYDSTNDTTTIYGQKFIDVLRRKPEQKVIDAGLAVREGNRWVKWDKDKKLTVNGEYVEVIKNPELKGFIMGPDNLFSSLISILSVPGVADALIKRILDDSEFKSVFIFNHVAQEETNGMSFRNIIDLIERVLNKDGMVSDEIKNKLGGKVSFSDVFTHIISNETLAYPISKYLKNQGLNQFGDPVDTKYSLVELELPEAALQGIESIREAPKDMANIKGLKEGQKVYIIETTAGRFLGMIEDNKLYALYVDKNGNYVGKARVDNYLEYYFPDGPLMGGGIAPEGRPRFLFFPNKGADIYQGIKVKDIYTDNLPENLPIYLLNSYTYLLAVSKIKASLQQNLDLTTPDALKDALMFFAGIEQPPWIYIGIPDHAEFSKEGELEIRREIYVGRYVGRPEKGRQFAPIYATEEDVKYLTDQGMNRNNIIISPLLNFQLKALRFVGPRLLTDRFIGIDKGIIENILRQIFS